MVLSILKKNYKCSLPHLHEVAAKRSEYSETPWADLTLYVLKRSTRLPFSVRVASTRGTVTAGMLGPPDNLYDPTSRQLSVGGFGIVV